MVLIVSMPDLCILLYFVNADDTFANYRISSKRDLIGIKLKDIHMANMAW